MAVTESNIIPAGVFNIGSLLVGAGLFWLFARAVYNIYFHPLSSFPGPRLAAASQLPHSYYSWKGTLLQWVPLLHQQYGEVVRTGPNELSFITDSAWRDIYMHRQGRAQFPKDFIFSNPNETAPLLSANDKSHSRQRRVLAHAFSDKALREQEPLLHVYVDLLISKLREESQANEVGVDLVDWYRYTASDIIADLCFGESFHNLENEAEHAWISNIQPAMKALHYLYIASKYPLLRVLGTAVLPVLLNAQREKSFKYPQDKVAARLNKKSERPDIMSYVLRYNDEKGISRDEIDSNFELLVLAGSDTTANLMIGCTYSLLKNPDVLDRLNTEVRTTFHTAKDINLTALSKMPYLLAVLEESLRMYSPTPAGFARRVLPEGATISERWVPGGTVVNIPPEAANRSARNFAKPNSFIPERWLDDHDPIFDNDRRAVMQPFSAGPRNCIGKNLATAEVRITVAKMIWHFDMELGDVAENWPDRKYWLVMETKPLLVKLKPRAL